MMFTRKRSRPSILVFCQYFIITPRPWDRTKGLNSTKPSLRIFPWDHTVVLCPNMRIPHLLEISNFYVSDGIGNTTCRDSQKSNYLGPKVVIQTPFPGGNDMAG